MLAVGRCELIDGYLAVRHEANDALYLLRNGDKLVVTFPNGRTYMDIEPTKIIAEPHSVWGFWIDGRLDGYTPEESAAPFIKRWDATMHLGGEL